MAITADVHPAGNCCPFALADFYCSLSCPETSPARTQYTPTHYVPHTHATPARRPRADLFSTPFRNFHISRQNTQNPPFGNIVASEHRCTSFGRGRNPAWDPQTAPKMHQMVLLGTLTPFPRHFAPQRVCKRCRNAFRDLSPPAADVFCTFSFKLWKNVRNAN